MSPLSFCSRVSFYFVLYSEVCENRVVLQGSGILYRTVHTYGYTPSTPCIPSTHDPTLSAPTDCAEMADQVYMEVTVGEEEASAIQEAQLDDSHTNKTLVPVAWAAAYGERAVFSPGLCPASIFVGAGIRNHLLQGKHV